jgi:hypothetical protein
MLVRSLLVGSVLVVGALGCTADGEDLGVVELYDDEARITVPALATAGAPFTVGLATYGGGCASRARTEVVVDGFKVDILPYDLRAQDDTCPDVLMFLDHSVGLTFATEGVVSVRIHGLRDDGDVVEEATWSFELQVEPAR